MKLRREAEKSSRPLSRGCLAKRCWRSAEGNAAPSPTPQAPPPPFHDKVVEEAEGKAPEDKDKYPSLSFSTRKPGLRWRREFQTRATFALVTPGPEESKNHAEISAGQGSELDEPGMQNRLGSATQERLQTQELQTPQQVSNRNSAPRQVLAPGSPELFKKGGRGGEGEKVGARSASTEPKTHFPLRFPKATPSLPAPGLPAPHLAGPPPWCRSAAPPLRTQFQPDQSRGFSTSLNRLLPSSARDSWCLDFPSPALVRPRFPSPSLPLPPAFPPTSTHPNLTAQQPKRNVGRHSWAAFA